jgi:hypothetical protein
MPICREYYPEPGCPVGLDTPGVEIAFTSYWVLNRTNGVVALNATWEGSGSIGFANVMQWGRLAMDLGEEPGQLLARHLCCCCWRCHLCAATDAAAATQPPPAKRGPLAHHAFMFCKMGFLVRAGKWSGFPQVASVSFNTATRSGGFVLHPLIVLNTTLAVGKRASSQGAYHITVPFLLPTPAVLA